MKYTPNEGRLLIKKLNQKDYIKSTEGLFVPGSGMMNKDLSRGIVVEGDEKNPRGTVVWYSDYSATTIYDEKLGQMICLSTEDVMVYERESTENDEEIIKELGRHDVKEVSTTTATNKS